MGPVELKFKVTVEAEDMAEVIKECLIEFVAEMWPENVKIEFEE